MTNTHTISTCNGEYTGTLLQCLQWQAANQGAMPDIDGIDISDLWVAEAHDANREDGDLTPEQAAEVVAERLAAYAD